MEGEGGGAGWKRKIGMETARGRGPWLSWPEAAGASLGSTLETGLQEGSTGPWKTCELAFQNSSGRRLTELGLELGY